MSVVFLRAGLWENHFIRIKLCLLCNKDDSNEKKKSIYEDVIVQITQINLKQELCHGLT